MTEREQASEAATYGRPSYTHRKKEPMPAVDHDVLPPPCEMKDGALAPFIKSTEPPPAPPPSVERAPELSAGESLARAALDHVDATDDDELVKRSLVSLFPG